MQDDSDKMLAFELEQIAQGGPLAFNKATILEAIDRLSALQAKLDAVTKDADVLQALLSEARYLAVSHLGLLTIDNMTDGVEQTRSLIERISALTDQGRTNES